MNWARAAAPSYDDSGEVKPGRAWLRALETIALATRDPERTLPRAAAEWARAYGDAPALLSDRETFSFRALEARMNQYLALGPGRGRKERRDSRSHDGESAGVFRDLARAYPSGRYRRARQS
jgi:hypothetical protein